MAQAALPSNALYDVQRYLRQRRATGAQITPQNERAAWSGYFNALEGNRLNETALELQRNRQDLIEKQMKQEEDAAKISGIGQLASTAGQAGMLLKGTDIGSKIGLGAPTATGAGPISATGGVTATGGAAPITAALTPASAGASEAALAGGMAPATAASVGPEAGILSAATPYLGPAGAGFAAGALVPKALGLNKGVGELAAGGISGAAIGAGVGSIVPGPGTAVGAVIGAIAGGIGSKVK